MILIETNCYYKIIQAREGVRHVFQPEVIHFILPKIKFDAPNYFALIEYDAIIIPPPPMSEFKDQELIASIIHPLTFHCFLVTHRTREGSKY